MISPLWKETIQEKYNVLVFPFAFHIAVQQPFKPLQSRLLLYELEPSQAPFALCFKSLLMTLLPASVVVSLFVWRLPFDLSSKEGPASSYATAGIAVKVIGILKPPQHDKVETPIQNTDKNWSSLWKESITPWRWHLEAEICQGDLISTINKLLTTPLSICWTSSTWLEKCSVQRSRQYSNIYS
jgi:hypothetical protein